MNWYESNAPAGDEALRPRGWAGRLWSPAIGAEHVACRERAALFDESSFAKIEVAGPGAADYLEWLCDNRVARDVGQITYTQMLNARGGIECDFTVTRVEDALFSIVTGTAFGNHDLSWIRRNAPADGSVRVSDVTSRWACFGLWGPRARDVLAPLTPDPLDFGYMTMRELAVGDVPVRALRVTFTGELGWELYCPTEFGAALWRALWEAGEPHGLAAGGYRAIDTLRLEKGYRVWAADITPDETPHEAGLGFCVAKDKEFAGRDALEGARAGQAPALPRARGPALGRAGQRAGARRRRDRRARDDRRLRLHGRALDRLRLPAAGPRRRHRGGGRHLRTLGRRRGGGRAALRSPRRAGAGVGSLRHRGGPMDPRDVQSIPLFAGLSKDDQKVVAQYADEVDVGPGTVLAQEGRLAYEFFAIKAGTAEVKLGGQHAAALGPGDFFGEIGLLAGDRRVASVVASSPMSLVVLTGSQLRAIDSRMPGVAERIRSAMAQRIAANRVTSG